MLLSHGLAVHDDAHESRRCAAGSVPEIAEGGGSSGGNSGERCAEFGVGTEVCQTVGPIGGGVGMSGTEKWNKSSRGWLVAFKKTMRHIFDVEKTVSVGAREVSASG